MLITSEGCVSCPERGHHRLVASSYFPECSLQDWRPGLVYGITADIGALFSVSPSPLFITCSLLTLYNCYY